VNARTRILGYLGRHRLLVGALVCTSVFSALLEGVGMTLFFPILQGMSGSGATAGGLAIPFPFDQVYAALGSFPLRERLQVVGVLLFAITLVKGMLIYTTVVVAARLQVRVVRHYRDDCAAQTMRVGMGFLNKQRTSDLLVVIDGYTESTAGAIVNLVGAALPQLFTMGWLLLLLVLLSWKLTVVSIALVAFASFVLTGLTRRIMDAGRALVATRYAFSRTLFDVIHGMKVIRLFNREQLMTERFVEADVKYNAARYRSTKLVGLIGPLFEVVGIGVLAAILVVGSLLVSHDSKAWLGILLTFMLILARLIVPVKQLNTVRAGVMEKLPTLYELDAFLSETGKEYLPSGTRSFERLEGAIEFRDVEFSYEPGTPVMRGMSFRIPRGAKVGVVGPSGGGKSTIAELLLRFYDPQGGAVLVDGVDLREIEVESWRRRVGVVTQDTFLFNDTIRNNIAFADPEASDEAVERAARQAYAHDFISAMPSGYATTVGDRGVLISGGQRQRLAIARAILAEPEILVFDEATSALDTESEQIVQEALDAVAEGRTVVTIAHRLSTVADSDTILVVADGRVAEQGTHQELLALGGVYRRLVEMQDLEPSDGSPEVDALT